MDLPTDSRSRSIGAWYGVFVGDALGTTLEFAQKPPHRRDAIPWHTALTGGGPFRLEPGDWTDDGAMTLCLARSLAPDSPPEMNLRRQLSYYLRWHDEGCCSSNGKCFDVGGQTSFALEHYRTTSSPLAPLHPDAQGNGGLMRAVPVPIWLAERGLPEGTEHPARVRAEVFSAACLTTHNSPVCSEASIVYSELVYQALKGASKSDLSSIAAQLVADSATRHPQFQQVASGIQGELQWEDLEPTGWVIHSLTIACWALFSFECFEQGMLEVVNLRGDADTNGAIYGGLAGSIYGIRQIPQPWLDTLKCREELDAAIHALFAPSDS